MLSGDATTCLLDVWKISGGDSTSSKLAFAHHFTLSTPCHHGRITHLEISDAFSIFVSACSKANAVLLWDLNTCSLVTVLTILPGPCTSIRIDAASGDILVTASYHIFHFDVNGRQIARLHVRDGKNVRMAAISAAHIATVPHPSTEGQLIITGHADGMVHVSQLVLSQQAGSDGGKYRIVPCHSFRAFDSKTAVTAISCNSSLSRVYVGGHDGSLRCWRRLG